MLLIVLPAETNFGTDFLANRGVVALLSVYRYENVITGCAPVGVCYSRGMCYHPCYTVAVFVVKCELLIQQCKK